MEDGKPGYSFAFFFMNSSLFLYPGDLIKKNFASEQVFLLFTSNRNHFQSLAMLKL